MPLNILVCVKQVPDTDQVKIDMKTGNLMRETCDGIMNKDDQYALSLALELKEKHADTTIAAITMGPPESYDVIFECLAKGADSGYILCDKTFAGADTRATSKTLALAAKKIGSIDLILTGRQASDGDTAQVGPQLAETLGMPHFSHVDSFSLDEEKRRAVIGRVIENAHETDEADLPLLCMCSNELAEPGYMTMNGIFKDKDITWWNREDLGLEEEEVGLSGSYTKVLGTFAIARGEQGLMISGRDEHEKAKEMLSILREKKLI